MDSFPKMTETVFFEGGSPREYAHFGWGDSETQFYGFIEGYKRAADLLVNTILREGHNYQLDTYVFPICFMYRQYIELALKDIYLSFSEDDSIKKKATVKRCSHDLMKIWKKARQIIERYFPNENREPLNATEEYIKQFAKEDISSFAFRYPVTKKLDKVHDKQRHLNLRNLMERMKELECFLSSVNLGISEMHEYEEEERRYYASEEMEEYFNDQY